VTTGGRVAASTLRLGLYGELGLVGGRVEADLSLRDSARIRLRAAPPILVDSRVVMS
jgi:hypothetical protein